MQLHAIFTIDRRFHRCVAGFLFTAVVHLDTVQCGEFYGEVAYMVPRDEAGHGGGPQCFVRDHLRICLKNGIVPTSTHEYGVGLIIKNDSTREIDIRADDFTLVDPRKNRRLARRSAKAFEYLMEKLGWGGAVMKQAMGYSFRDTIRVAAGTEIFGILRFYDPGSSPPAKSEKRRFGERYADLFDFEGPIELRVLYQNATVATPRLHLLRYVGSPSPVIISKKLGFEHERLTSKSIVESWMVAFPVKRYWYHSDGRHKMIEFTDHRFEITRKKSSDRYCLGRFVYRENGGRRLTIQPAPATEEGCRAPPRLPDVNQPCVIESVDGGQRLSCSEEDIWTSP